MYACACVCGCFHVGSVSQELARAADCPSAALRRDEMRDTRGREKERQRNQSVACLLPYFLSLRLSQRLCLLTARLRRSSSLLRQSRQRDMKEEEDGRRRFRKESREKARRKRGEGRKEEKSFGVHRKREAGKGRQCSSCKRTTEEVERTNKDAVQVAE